MNRRTFLKTSCVMTAGAGLLGLGNSTAWADDRAGSTPHADKLGWRLGCQAWTFHTSTFHDAMDKTAALGLHVIEAFPGQPLSADTPNAKIGPQLSMEARKEVKKRLADKGLKLVNFGVGPANKEAFDFAKDMGIETLVSEPPFNAFDKLDKLCEEYQINVALHDHPKPAPYWSPDIVLQACKGHSKRIGACCDTGHWMRSNINPVEALRMLQGRIISFHLKDLNKYGRDSKDKRFRDVYDVPWGTGQGDIKGVLTEVKRQGIKPVFSIEYEHEFTMPELAQCVAYFDKVAGELAG